MADPITISTTLITLASFIKDLIDLGQSIKNSIEKVRDNRRRIRNLADDILRPLAGLDALILNFRDRSPAPELLQALGDLKAIELRDMMYVLSVARRLSLPERSPGFRGFRSQIKVWLQRDNMAEEIQRLKDHVNKCYLQFTSFSAARNEHTSLRVEQALIVNNAENQVRLRRLEEMMARMLLNTPFGQDVATRTLETISSDPTHQTLESHYLSAQATRLFDSLQKFTAAGNFCSEPPLYYDSTKPMEIIFAGSVSSAHVLHAILGLVLQINTSTGSGEIPMIAIAHHLNYIGEYLSCLGMHSAATTSGILSTKILRRLADADHRSAVLPCLALALDNLSRKYYHQMRCDLALEASHQSLDLCHLCSESSPDVDNQPLFLSALITHSNNLLISEMPATAVSIAQEAVVISQLILSNSFPMSITKDIHPQDEWTAAKCCAAFFALASAYASAERYHEAYQASREGLETMVRFSGRVPAPPANDIDTAVDLLCRVAEVGQLSSTMLASTVLLYRDLARIYLEEFAFQFLSILHAHVYFASKRVPKLDELRLFLEPSSEATPPALTTSDQDFLGCIQHFNQYGGVAEDAVHAFYASSATFFDATSSLIQHIFSTHFDRATMVLRTVATSLLTNPCTSSGVLAGAVTEIFDILPFVSDSEQISLLDIMADLIKHLRAIAGSPRAARRDRQHFTCALLSYFCGALLKGRLSEALAVTYEALRCLNLEEEDEREEHCDWLLCRSLVLFDLGRFGDANSVLQDSALRAIAHGDQRRHFSFTLFHSLVRSRILRSTGKLQDALQFLGERTDGSPSPGRDRILLIELAVIHLELGNFFQALGLADKAVALCSQSSGRSIQHTHPVNYVLIYALNILSNCLAAVGRNEEGLRAVEEAAALILPINSAVPVTWSTLLLRPQELFAITYHTLSLRLVVSGNVQKALTNAEKAVDLYRGLVLLAVRHRPFLAICLRNFSSLLRNVGLHDEATTVFTEAAALALVQ